MEIQKNDVRVSFVNLDEGYHGGYNDQDPEDETLLRFDVDIFVDGEWMYVNDSSRCTCFPVDTTVKQQTEALHIIMDHVYEPIIQGKSIKRICDRLSYISPSWLKQEEQDA